MSGFIPLAYHHAYGGGWADWLTHVVVSSVVHAMVYSLVFRALSRLTFGQEAFLIAAVLLVLFMWSRNRDRRG